MILDFHQGLMNTKYIIRHLYYAYKWKKDIINTILDWYNNSNDIYVYTSGSTGKAKLIKISKKNVIKSVYATANYFHLSDNINSLLCISPNYIGGKMLIFRAIILKWRLFCIKPNTHPLKNINFIFDFVSMVPIQAYNSIFYIDSKIKILLIGGAPVSLKLENMILQYIKQSHCYLSYGMTETIGHIAVRNLNEKNKYFIALNKVHLSTDINKCLIINIPHMFKYKIITKDIVDLKISNFRYYFKWLGRIDNIINYNGLKVVPEQLEYFLSFYIKKNFFIYGIADDICSSKIYLFIEGSYTRCYIPQIYIIKKLKLFQNTIFIKYFIKTETGKINRIKTLQSINLLNTYK